MGLKDTIKTMHKFLTQIAHDLKKSENGNKAASQRVRTGSIKMAKVAKKYRKESVSEEKKVKKAKKKIAKKTKRKVPKKKPAMKKATKRKVAKKKTTKRRRK